MTIDAVVVGAGAFGGWTALHLLRRGARVTLLDAWGPGNSRASSGGETRIVRSIYRDRAFVEMSARALELWKENQARWNLRLYRPTGVVWMASRDQQFENAATHFLREAGIQFEELTGRQAQRRYPQIDFEGVERVLVEQDAGYLTARRACQAVLDGFVQEGGLYRQLAGFPGKVDRGRLQSLSLSDGSKLSADCYVFACGPWLGKIFPETLAQLIRPSRQEVFFFGTPAGDSRFLEEELPVWIDNGSPRFYGVPGNEGRGFKLADDTRGPAFDPTSGERLPTAEGLKAARNYLERRFPALRAAPLLEARVCQYENSPDEHFIIDRHPVAANVWLVGGGSGHGFKHGPAVGELVAAMLLGEKSEALFGLKRFEG